MPDNFVDPQSFFDVDRIAFDKGVSEDDCGFTVFLDKDGKHIQFLDPKRKGQYSKVLCTSKLVIDDVPLSLKTIHQPTYRYPFTEIYPENNESMKCRINIKGVTNYRGFLDDKEVECYSDTQKKEKTPEELIQEFKKIKALSKEIRGEIERRKR